MRSPQATCWTIIRAARAGEEAARERFVLWYTPAIEGYLKSRWRTSSLLGHMADAKQEVFLLCFREDGVLDRVSEDRPGGFRAYLFGVARNVARAHEKRWARRREVPTVANHVVDVREATEESASRAFDRGWAQAVLREALDLLRERCASEDEGRLRLEILRQHTCEGISLRELARRFAMERSAVRRRFEKARRELESTVREVLALHVSNDPLVLAREWETLHELLG